MTGTFVRNPSRPWPAPPPDYAWDPGPRHEPAGFDGSASAVVGLLVAVFKYRRRILVSSAVTLLLALGALLGVQNVFKAHSAVLATMSVDYSARPDAGSSTMSNGSLEQEQIVRTERDILDNDALHRAVLRKIGPTIVFPHLLEKPHGLAWVVAGVKRLPSMIAGRITGSLTIEKAPVDPVEAALVPFDANFTTEASKDSTAITLNFSSSDPAMAARVLNVTMATYLERRRELYTSPQASIVAGRVAMLREQLDAANARLNAYKVAHDIGDFRARQQILETNRGVAEQRLSEVIGQEAQSNARIASLTDEVQRVPAIVVTRRDITADTHADPEHKSVAVLRETLNKLASTYQPNSPVVQRLRAQLQASEREFQRVENNGIPSSVQYADNPLWAKANLDLLQATNDYKAAQAYHQRLLDYINNVDSVLRGRTSLDAELTQLEQQRQVAVTSYSSGVQELEQRRLIDMVDARKQTSTRVLEVAEPPLHSTGVRKLIGIVGIFLSVLVGALVALLSNYFRSYYLTASELERDLGLPVLANIHASSVIHLTGLGHYSSGPDR